MEITIQPYVRHDELSLMVCEFGPEKNHYVSYEMYSVRDNCIAPGYFTVSTNLIRHLPIKDLIYKNNIEDIYDRLDTKYRVMLDIQAWFGTHGLGYREQLSELCDRVRKSSSDIHRLFGEVLVYKLFGAPWNHTSSTNFAELTKITVGRNIAMRK